MTNWHCGSLVYWRMTSVTYIYIWLCGSCVCVYVCVCGGGGGHYLLVWLEYFTHFWILVLLVRVYVFCLPDRRYNEHLWRVTVFSRGYTHHLAASFPVNGPLSGQDSGWGDRSVSASWPLAKQPLLDRCAETAPNGKIPISKPLLEKNWSSRNPLVPPCTKRSEGEPQLGDYVDKRVADFISDLKF